MQPLPELEGLRLRCDAGFHTTPPVECGRTRGGEREFPHWREQGAGSGEQYATLRLERGTQYGWASRRPTSHADSTASHPSAADPHRPRSEPSPPGRRQIAWATRVLREIGRAHV